MMALEQAMKVMDRPVIADLKTDCMTTGDIVDLILQRSEIIRDQPRYNRYIKAWIKQDEAPIHDLIAQIGADELVRRAAAFIYLEYQALRPLFQAKPPRKIADIGCGYGLFDLFLARDYGCKLCLINLESNERRHFGFDDEGAAYSSLAQTRALLVANGVPDGDIDTRNPETDDLSDIRGLDYAFSFISCGFHYPWTTYRSFFQEALQPGGQVILDVRSQTIATVLHEVSEIGMMRGLHDAASNCGDRIMIVPTP